VSFFDRFRKRPVALAASQHTALLVARCLDHLTLLYPRGWQSVAIGARVGNDGAMSLDSLDVTPHASTEPSPEFPDDAGERTALLADTLRQLCISVAVPLADHRTLPMRATPDAIEILDHTFAADGVRLYTPAFMRALTPALRGGHQAFEQRQEQFRRHFAETAAGGLRWDRPAGVLALTNAAGETSTVEAHILGSFAPSDHTWCWVWANSGLASAEQAAIRRVRDETELALLREPGFFCTEPFSFAVAALAAYAIDPELHLWRWPQTAHLFFAVRLG